MSSQFIVQRTIARRNHWLDNVISNNRNFVNDTTLIANELERETTHEGLPALLDHLRMASAIPERYQHDSSEEKLYSKYTDILLSAAFNYIGLNSVVLSERADSADVEAGNEDYTLVADAKAFRLSRTAKNQKDFKIESLHHWKRGKPFAMVVCPIYQLPNRTSQIYQQAISRNVCIFTWSHLAVLVRLANYSTKNAATDILHKILCATEILNPEKDATPYWNCINRCMLNSYHETKSFWLDEKVANQESIIAAKQEALIDIAKERQIILQMTHQQAINALMKGKNIEGRITMVNKVTDSGILEFL